MVSPHTRQSPFLALVGKLQSANVFGLLEDELHQLVIVLDINPRRHKFHRPLKIRILDPLCTINLGP